MDTKTVRYKKDWVDKSENQVEPETYLEQSRGKAVVSHSPMCTLATRKNGALRTKTEIWLPAPWYVD